MKRYRHALEPASTETGDDGKPTPASLERNKASAEALAEFHHKPITRSHQLPAFHQQIVTTTTLAVVEALKQLGVIPAAKK